MADVGSRPKKLVSESAFEYILHQCVSQAKRQPDATPQSIAERLDQMGYHVGERLSERQVLLFIVRAPLDSFECDFFIAAPLQDDQG
jgi:hypothetical protein